MSIDYIKASDSAKYLVETPNGAKVILMTECDYDSLVPRLWVQALPVGMTVLGSDKIMEETEYEAYKMLSESKEIPKDVSDWCKKVLETADILKTTLEQNDFKETSFDFGNTSLTIAPFKSGDGNSLNDVEYYLTENDIIGGDSSIYAIAMRLTNYDLLVAEKQNDTIKLQEFYEEKVHPIRNIPFDKLTETQREDRAMFSDWHKDIYGHRPHDDSRNECYKAMAKGSKSKNDYEKE